MSRNVEHVLEANELLYDKITESLSDQSVKKYNNDKLTLAELDKWRTDELPSILRQRFEKKSNCWLTKDELILLMDWKLAKGVFRPSLPKLIKSNPPDQVEEITKAGFTMFLDYIKEIKNAEDFWKDDSEERRKQYKSNIRSTFKKICELKGVGPATASLILSLLCKINKYLVPPFFSDESFMYYVVDPVRPDTKIKYSVKEYVDELLESYFDILFDFKSDNFLNMDILEKGGWSLKMYDIHRFDTLADLKVPFEVNDSNLNKFIYSSKDDEKKISKDTGEEDVDQPLLKKQKK